MSSVHGARYATNAKTCCAVKRSKRHCRHNECPAKQKKQIPLTNDFHLTNFPKIILNKWWDEGTINIVRMCTFCDKPKVDDNNHRQKSTAATTDYAYYNMVALSMCVVKHGGGSNECKVGTILHWTGYRRRHRRTFPCHGPLTTYTIHYDYRLHDYYIHIG